MENKQYHISSRNNYFLGKLMTARDFFAEQEYFNSKRRLGNRFMFSPGIIAGMNIFLIDNKTFSLEPGIAVDYYGREIIVPKTCVRKFDLVEGFEKLKSSDIPVYLCIKYKESLCESTFSIANQDGPLNQKQFNRICEKYEVFITDTNPDDKNLKIDSLFFQNIEIYNENGLKLWGKFPKYVNPGQNVKVKVFLEKYGVGEPVYFNFKISGVLFKDKTNVSYDENDTQLYSKIEKEGYLTCNAENEAISEFVIAKDDFILRIGMKDFNLAEDIKINFNVTKKTVKDVIIENYYSINFEKLIEDNDEKFIYLAKMQIINNDVGYSIENFQKIPANQYVLNNEILRLIQEINIENTKNNLRNFFDSSKTNKSLNDNEESYNRQTEKLIEKDNIISGVETINLGFKPKPGKVYYSYEFVHGLGPGNVSIETAIVNDENEELEEQNLLIFGDRSIFGLNEVNLSVPDVQVACLVNPAKGTMRLGVRLEDRTNVQSIKIRWWAMKPIENSAEKDDLVINENLKIIVSPDSATIQPLEQIRFSAKIIGVEDQRVSWNLGKFNPGKIDSNGLYTAPASEGIFEIVAQSVNFESLKASAYVVVTTDKINLNRNEKEGEEEEN